MTANISQKTKFMQISIDTFPKGGLPVTEDQKNYYRDYEEGALHGAVFALKNIIGNGDNGIIPGSYDSTDIHLSTAGYIWLGGTKTRYVEMETVRQFLESNKNSVTDLGLFGLLSTEENEKLRKAIKKWSPHSSNFKPNDTVITPSV